MYHSIHVYIELQVEKEKEKKKGKSSSALSFVSAGLGLGGTSSSTGSSSSSSSAPVANVQLKAILSFSLDADQSAYVLNIELQSNIDLIVLMSPVNLEIIESGLMLVVLYSR